MKPHRPAVRRKQALSHTGGETVVAGEPAVAEALAHALATEDLPRDRLTHGFHSYPARMHWCTAERVLQSFASAGARVLDPFCGSGTVLVEASAAGLPAMGVDLNPLAVRLARLKCDPLDRARRSELEHAACAVREASEARVRARENVRANLSPSELAWYEPHVLKEMAGLLASIRELDAEPWLREALELVFSSLVIKFSRQRSETSEELVTRRIRKGLVSEFFERKASELCERLGALEQIEARAGARERNDKARGPLPQVVEGDALWLRDLLPRGAVDLVLTSPPYGGTYDYAAHHARRFAWLGIEARALQEHELGARRRDQAAPSFARELSLALRSLRQVLVRDGWLVLLMGDSQHGDERVPADRLVEELADEAGFEPVALASQPRPDFTGGPPRAEHLMALRARTV